jgi:hypothetical protein
MQAIGRATNRPFSVQTHPLLKMLGKVCSVTPVKVKSLFISNRFQPIISMSLVTIAYGRRAAMGSAVASFLYRSCLMPWPDPSTASCAVMRILSWPPQNGKQKTDSFNFGPCLYSRQLMVADLRLAVSGNV